MILLIADSVLGGFGQPQKKSFVHHALESLGVRVFDHSASGMSTQDYLDFLRTGEKVVKEQCHLYCTGTEFDCVIIALGNVDCKGVFKSKNFFSKIVPSRYRAEKLDPRPYYSKSLGSRFIQLAENSVRQIFRRYLYITGNLSAKISQESTIINLKRIMSKHESTKIILVSTSCINDILFPGSHSRFEAFNSHLMMLSKQENISYFDMRPGLGKKFLMKDEFHLNFDGHQLVRGKFEEFFKRVIG